MVLNYSTVGGGLFAEVLVSSRVRLKSWPWKKCLWNRFGQREIELTVEGNHAERGNQRNPGRASEKCAGQAEPGNERLMLCHASDLGGELAIRHGTQP